METWKRIFRWREELDCHCLLGAGGKGPPLCSRTKTVSTGQRQDGIPDLHGSKWGGGGGRTHCGDCLAKFYTGWRDGVREGRRHLDHHTQL